MSKDLKKFQSIFACPKCGDGLVRQETNIKCTKCGKQFPVSDGKIYFIEPPKNAPTPKKTDGSALLKENWSEFRLACYDYESKILLKLPKGGKVLDIGAGRAFYRDIIKHFDSYISLDFFPYENIDAVVDISGRLPLKSGSVDVVIVANVLEHVPDMNFTLKECFRVLKSEGILVGITPFLMHLHDEPYDYSRPTKFLIKKNLEDAKFTKVSTELISTVHDVYYMISRDYFHTMLNHGGGGVISRVIVRFFRKMNSLALGYFRYFYPNLRNERIPAGYGFLAVKR